MLQLHILQHSQQRLQLFDKANLKESTWLVSDLKTKSGLQDRLLSSTDILEDETILRVAELWKLLFFRHFPHWRILSPDITKALIAKWADDMPYGWAKSAGAPAEILSLLQELAPCLEIEDGRIQLGEWFRENPHSYLLWGEWYHAAEAVWRKLRDLNWVPGNCQLAHLGGLQSFRWERPLFVDLGPDLKVAEAEILKALSRELDVTVLVAEDLLTCEAYSLLAGPKTNQKVDKPTPPRLQALRFATSLSEVKDCVHQVRKWLDSGVAPDRIAIVAPDPKPFERVLSMYFDVEGVPFSCDATHSLTDLPTIAEWMARLSMVDKPDRAALEQTIYGYNQVPVIDFDRFRQLYTNIYADADLQRSRQVYELVTECQSDGPRDLNRDQFVAKSLALMPVHAPFERVESLLKSILLDAPESLELPTAAWLNYLRARAVQAEGRLRDGQFGVRLLKIDSFDDQSVDCVYLLDLSDGRMRKQASRRLPTEDLVRLRSELGWPLNLEDPLVLEWKVRWSLSGIREGVLAFSATDWSGQPQAPSLIWLDQRLQEGRVVEEVDRPRPTVWDSRQSQVRSKTLPDMDPSEHQFLIRKVDADRGQADFEAVPYEPQYLSATGVEDFKKCPFIYAAKRIYGLRDPSAVDLDVDPMARGNLLHAVFETILLESPPALERTDSEIEKLVEDAADRTGLWNRFSPFWKSQRSFYIQIVREFLAFEREWRLKRPNTSTSGVETDVDGFFDPKIKKFQRHESEGAVAFRGRIDRVDGGEAGQLCLIDYKSSTSGLVAFKTGKTPPGQWPWIEQKKFQLGIYALAVEAGLTSLGPRPVESVVYFNIKKMERRLGFRSDEQVGGLYLLEDKYPPVISNSEQQEFLGSLSELFAEVIEQIRLGQISPNPWKPEECQKCDWRTVCRAPHLN